MTDAAWVALAAGVPATISSLAALIIAIRTGRKVDQVERQTNSMHDKLMKGAYEKGGADERARTS